MSGGTKREDATTGVDSLGKAVRRNLSLKKLGMLLSWAFGVLRGRGWQALWREVDFRLRLATHRETWRYRADIPLRRELRAQKKAAQGGTMGDMPCVSVVVPLYNTPVRYLKQMIRSVRRQSYPHWELVLADASDGRHPEVGEICEKQAQKDGRIRYVRLEANGGIAENTNAGIAESHGEWLALLDHDDVIQPNALYEVVAAANATGAELVYSDEIVLDERLKKLGEYHFKGDYGPDTLRGCNYITHLCAFCGGLLQRAGGGESARYDGAQDYDLVLRLTERATVVHHIPKVLYFWRRHGGSTAGGMSQKPEAAEAGEAAVQAQLERMGLEGMVTAEAAHPGAYQISYEVTGRPQVSVLIPSCDHVDDLKRCLDSLYDKGGWPHLEVVVVENNSHKAETFDFYEHAQRKYHNLKVLKYPGRFNFSDINNYAAKLCAGQHLLLLNNDVELTSPGFVRELLSYSQRPDVGAVGAMLYYPDDTVQHAGLILGIGGTAGVSHKGHARGDGGNMFRLCTPQNVTAVTGAALMVKRSLYLAAGGLDAESFAVAFNDVDFCLKLRVMGLWNVFTPFAAGYHFESKSRGYDTEGPNRERFEAEAARFKHKWAAALAAGDPFYNPHFTQKHENFGYR